MRRISSATSLGLDVCAVTLHGHGRRRFYVSSAAYRRAYDQCAASFDLGNGLILRDTCGGLDFDALPAPQMPAGPVWAIQYAPEMSQDWPADQRADELAQPHIHELIEAPSAELALIRHARTEDPTRQAGIYYTDSGKRVQLVAVPFELQGVQA